MGNYQFKTDFDTENITAVSKANFTYNYCIGKGGFGKVWKVARKKAKQEFAMKEMSKARVITKRSVKSVINERQILAELNNPFIVNMYYAFQDRENLYLVMDYLAGGDLRYHICRYRRFNEETTRFFIACLMQGLEYIHDKNIIHRDIKPENLVVDAEGYVRITDFGIARMWRPDNAQDTSGTPGYMAPEVMCRQNHTISVDYFAIGVMAFECMFGRRPYIGKSRKEIRDHILSKQIQIKRQDIPRGWSIEAADFINKMIQRKPQNRLGANGPLEVKRHPWLRDFPWQDLTDRKIKAPFIPPREDNFDEKNINEEWKDLEDENFQENLLQLRRMSVQELFNGYYFDFQLAALTKNAALIQTGITDAILENIKTQEAQSQQQDPLDINQTDDATQSIQEFTVSHPNSTASINNNYSNASAHKQAMKISSSSVQKQHHQHKIQSTVQPMSSQLSHASTTHQSGIGAVNQHHHHQQTHKQHLKHQSPGQMGLGLKHQQIRQSQLYQQQLVQQQMNSTMTNKQQYQQMLAQQQQHLLIQNNTNSKTKQPGGIKISQKTLKPLPQHQQQFSKSECPTPKSREIDTRHITNQKFFTRKSSGIQQHFNNINQLNSQQQQQLIQQQLQNISLNRSTISSQSHSRRPSGRTGANISAMPATNSVQHSSSKGKSLAMAQSGFSSRQKDVGNSNMGGLHVHSSSLSYTKKPSQHHVLAAQLAQNGTQGTPGMMNHGLGPPVIHSSYQSTTHHQKAKSLLGSNAPANSQLTKSNNKNTSNNFQLFGSSSTFQNGY